MAVVDIYNGNLEAACEALNKVLVIFRNVGDSIGIIQVLHNRARIDLLRGNFASAKKLLVEALESSWRLNARNELAAIYLLFSLLYLRQGESQSSLNLLSLIDQLMKRYSITFPPYDQKIYESTRNRLRKDLSADKFAQYWQQGCETNEAEIVKRYIKTAAHAAV